MAQLIIKPVNGDTICETGKLHFNPHNGCYYINGNSYPVEIASQIVLGKGEIMHILQGGETV